MSQKMESGNLAILLDTSGSMKRFREELYFVSDELGVLDDVTLFRNGANPEKFEEAIEIDSYEGTIEGPTPLGPVLESLSEQTDSDSEILVVTDGVADKPQRLQEALQEIDQDVRVFQFGERGDMKDMEGVTGELFTVHYGCPKCLFFNEFPSERTAAKKAKSHNESRHNGEEIARVIKPTSRESLREFVEVVQDVAPLKYRKLLDRVEDGDTPFEVEELQA